MSFQQIQFITTQEELQAVISECIRKALTDFPNAVQVTQSEDDDIIDTDELCKRLDVSKPTLLRWRKKGKLKAMKLGGSIRYNYAEVLKSMDDSDSKRKR